MHFYCFIRCLTIIQHIPEKSNLGMDRHRTIQYIKKFCPHLRDHKTAFQLAEQSSASIMWQLTSKEINQSKGDRLSTQSVSDWTLCSLSLASYQFHSIEYSDECWPIKVYFVNGTLTQIRFKWSSLSRNHQMKSDITCSIINVCMVCRCAFSFVCVFECLCVFVCVL